MVEQSLEPAMSRKAFSVSYHGQNRKQDHTIDVQILGPALLAFGRLLREANNQFNSKKSTTKVLVVSDFEHKCFNINFELVVSLYEQVRSLVSSDSAKSAKDILEWIGLLTGGGVSYLAYLRWKKGREVTPTSFSDKDGTGTVTLSIPGEHNSITIKNQIFQFSENPAALRATRELLTPLGQDGFDRVEIDDGSEGKIDLDESAAADIIASCDKGMMDAKELVPEVAETTAWLSVYSPVYDLSASKWRFKLGTDVIYADISKTSIASEAMKRGGAMVEDSYFVRLEITVPLDQKGNKREPEYKVLEVIRFTGAGPQARQQPLL